MYQIQLFKRNKKGKKGDLIATIVYCKLNQAQAALKTCKTIEAGKQYVPCDIECSPTGQKLSFCSNYIPHLVTDAK